MEKRNVRYIFFISYSDIWFMHARNDGASITWCERTFLCSYGNLLQRHS